MSLHVRSLNEVLPTIPQKANGKKPWKLSQLDEILPSEFGIVISR
jgi:hypothetical protein